MKPAKLSDVPEFAPLTILCHHDGVEIENDMPGVMDVSPTETVAFADSLSYEDWVALKGDDVFCSLFSLVFTKDIDPRQIDNLPKCGMGVRHIVGMICLIASAIKQKKRPLVRLPESYLHPRSQLGLADLFVALSNFPQYINGFAAKKGTP